MRACGEPGLQERSERRLPSNAKRSSTATPLKVQGYFADKPNGAEEEPDSSHFETRPWPFCGGKMSILRLDHRFIAITPVRTAAAKCFFQTSKIPETYPSGCLTISETPRVRIGMRVFDTSPRDGIRQLRDGFQLPILCTRKCNGLPARAKMRHGHTAH